MDIDNDGKISWDEFLTAACNKVALLNEKNIKAAFKILDTNGDGQITKAELKAKFGSVEKDKVNLEKEDLMWKEIMEEVDKNKDGIISWKEFKKGINNVLKVKLSKLHPQEQREEEKSSIFN